MIDLELLLVSVDKSAPHHRDRSRSRSRREKSRHSSRGRDKKDADKKDADKKDADILTLNKIKVQLLTGYFFGHLVYFVSIWDILWVLGIFSWCMGYFLGVWEFWGYFMGVWDIFGVFGIFVGAWDIFPAGFLSA